MIVEILARYLATLTGNPAATTSLLVALSLLSIVLVAMSVIGFWKIFQKAGRPGWFALVPFLDEFKAYEIAWPSQSWLFWLCLLLQVGEISLTSTALGGHTALANVLFVIWTIIRFPLCIALAKSFGKSNAFGIGLWAADFVFAPLLGFGPEAYKGPVGGVARSLPVANADAGYAAEFAPEVEAVEPKADFVAEAAFEPAPEFAPEADFVAEAAPEYAPEFASEAEVAFEPAPEPSYPAEALFSQFEHSHEDGNEPEVWPFVEGGDADGADAPDADATIIADASIFSLED